MNTYKEYTDEMLWDFVRKDDQRAFDELFTRYWKKIHIFVFSKTRSKEITADIIQELFASIWERRNEVVIQNFSNYLHTAAKYKCINFIKDEIASRKRWEYYKNFLPSSEESTAKTVEFNDLMKALEESIDQLPEKSKQIFRQSRFEGKSVHQLASHFNITEKAIEYHITQSIRHLKINLKDFNLFLLLFLIS